MLRREAKKGSGDEIPRQVWAAAQRIPHREARINKNLSGAEGRKSQGAPKPSAPSGRNQRGGAWGIARSDGTSRLCEFPGARLCEFPMPEATIEIPEEHERISVIIAGFFFFYTHQKLSMDSNRIRAALGLRGVVDVTGNSHSRGILPLLAIPHAPPL